MRTDNWSELVNNRFKNVFDKLDIKHELTNIYSPEMNGVVERYNRTAKDVVSVLLEDSGLDKVFGWRPHCTFHTHGISYAININLSSHLTPLKPFRSKIFVGIPDKKKLDNK